MGHILYVRSLVLARFAIVSQDISENHQTVDLNVSSTLTVPQHLPVETTNATILALEHAVSTLSAIWSTTTQCALACQHTSEILSLAAELTVLLL